MSLDKIKEMELAHVLRAIHSEASLIEINSKTHKQYAICIQLLAERAIELTEKTK